MRLAHGQAAGSEERGFRGESSSLLIGCAKHWRKRLPVLTGKAHAMLMEPGGVEEEYKEFCCSVWRHMAAALKRDPGSKQDEIRTGDSQAELLDKSAAQRLCPPYPNPTGLLSVPYALPAHTNFPFKPRIDSTMHPPRA